MLCFVLVSGIDLQIHFSDTEVDVVHLSSRTNFPGIHKQMREMVRSESITHSEPLLPRLSRLLYL